MSVRLLTPAEVAGWRTRLSIAMDAVASQQHATIGARLRSAGLGWDDPTTAAPPTLWDQPQWAAAVDRHFTPVATEVASDIIGRLHNVVTAAAAWGAMPAADQLVNLAVDRALAGGPQIGRRIVGDTRLVPIVTASGPPSEFRRPAGANIKTIKRALEDAAPKSIVHPDTARSIADTYAANVAQLSDLAARSAGPMANAATQMLAAATESTVTLSWHCAFEPTSRADHEDADGQTSIAGEPFDIGGESLMYPGDPSGSDEQTANCVAEGTSVVLPGLRHTMRRWYEGEMIELRYASGHRLTVTPNHPVLGPLGQLQPAKDLQVGDHSISGRLVWRCPGQPDVQARPAEVGQVHRSATLAGSAERIGTLPPDFHGDGSHGEVDVATPDRLLGSDAHPSSDEQVEQFLLAAADGASSAQGRSGGSTIPVLTNGTWAAWCAPIAPRPVGCARELVTVLDGHQSLPIALGGTPSARFDIGTQEPAPDGITTDCEDGSQGEFALTLDVATDQLVDVHVDPQWAGWVYNFDTGHGWYLTDTGSGGGLIVGNCLCWLEVEDGGDIVEAAAEEEGYDLG